VKASSSSIIQGYALYFFPPYHQITRAQPFDRGMMAVDAQATNNSTFQNERDIGKVAYYGACDYSKKHMDKTSINSLHGESIFMFT
jgi:hypothetical protein